MISRIQRPLGLHPFSPCDVMMMLCAARGLWLLYSAGIGEVSGRVFNEVSDRCLKGMPMSEGDAQDLVNTQTDRF